MLLFVFLACLWLGNTAPRAGSNQAIYLRGEAKLVPELTIGGGPDEGDAPPVFYRPRDVDVAPDGTIYVLDDKTCQIVVFEASGQYRERFAGEGEGPGELREPTRIAIDRTGNVLVYEAGNKRFSWFSRDGYIVDVKRFDRDVVRFDCTREGNIVAQTETEHYGRAATETKWTLVVLDSTLARQAILDSLSVQRWIHANVSGGIASATQPFYEDIVWCASATGQVYVAHGAAYEIETFSSNFDPGRTLRRQVSAVAITREERKRYLEKLGGSPLIGNALAEQVRWPAHRPHIEALYCDAEGNLLVHRGIRDGATLLDVYRPDGTFLGEVKISGLNRSAAFHGASIFMRVFSDYELPAVIRYRME